MILWSSFPVSSSSAENKQVVTQADLLPQSYSGPQGSGLRLRIGMVWPFDQRFQKGPWGNNGVQPFQRTLPRSFLRDLHDSMYAGQIGQPLHIKMLPL